MTTARERRLGYLSWIAVCLIWGTTYLGIRICLESIPPALMGGLRWTLAGSLLSAYVLLRGEPFPPMSRWGSILLLGFLLLGLGNGGVVFAEQWVPSGLAAVLVATAPFWMASVEAALPDGERMHRNTVIGLLIGFSGILVLVWPDLAPVWGAFAALSRARQGEGRNPIDLNACYRHLDECGVTDADERAEWTEIIYHLDGQWLRRMAARDEQNAHSRTRH